MRGNVFGERVVNFEHEHHAHDWLRKLERIRAIDNQEWECKACKGGRGLRRATNVVVRSLVSFSLVRIYDS